MSEKSLNFNNNSLEYNKKEDHKAYTVIPYSVTRNVLSQDDLEELSGYDRHKDTRKNLLIQCLNLHSNEILLLQLLKV